MINAESDLDAKLQTESYVTGGNGLMSDHSQIRTMSLDTILKSGEVSHL